MTPDTASGPSGRQVRNIVEKKSGAVTDWRLTNVMPRRSLDAWAEPIRHASLGP